MMRKQFWRSRTFQIWFLGCFSILLLPLISSFIYYGNVQENLEAKSYEVNQMAIEQAANVIDEKFNMLYNAGDSVFVSSEIKRIKFLSLPYDAQTYYELHQRASYLANFSMQYDLFRYLYVYYSDMHCLMDGQRLYTELNQIESILRSRVHMQEADFISLTAQPHYNSLYLLDDGTILFLRTLSTRGVERLPIITLVAVMNTDSLYEVLAQTANNANGYAYLLSPDGMALGLYDESALPAYEEVLNLSQTTQLDDADYVTVHMRSSVSDLLYVLSIPHDAFLLDVTRARQWFLFANGIALFLGFVFCYYMAVRNYRPVHALKQRIQTDEQSKDDFALINGKLTELIAGEGNMRQEMQKMTQIASMRAFHMLLDGRLGEMEGLQREHLHLTGTWFVVACLHQDDNGDWSLNSGHAMPDAVLSMLLSDLCDGHCEYAIHKENEGYAIIFGFATQRDPIDAQLSVEGFCTRLLERITAHFPHISIRIYIGDAQEGLENVHRSWQNALRAKDYAGFALRQDRMVVPFDPTMYSSDISWQEYDIMGAERNFINLMLEGNYAKAEQLLHEILSYYSYTDGMSLYVLRCRMFGMMNMMLNILHEIEPDLTSDDYRDMSPVEMLLEARTPAELEKVVLNIIGQLVGLQESKTVDSRLRVDQIQRYIATNYYDVNLSVQMVATAFDMSLPYLSRIFKKAHGSGLLDYINHYRVEKAKAFMLAYEDETIASIAARVGFNSSQTLIRAFKRYEKVTPGQYKEALGERDENPHL